MLFFLFPILFLFLFLFTCQFYCIRTSKTLTHLIAFLNAHIHQVGATGVLRISLQLLRNFALIAERPKFWLTHGVFAHSSYVKQYSRVKHSQVSEVCSEPGQLMPLVWRTSTTIPTVAFWCAVGTVTEDWLALCCLLFPERFSGKKICGSGVLSCLCSFLFLPWSTFYVLKLNVLAHLDPYTTFNWCVPFLVQLLASGSPKH